MTKGKKKYQCMNCGWQIQLNTSHFKDAEAYCDSCQSTQAHMCMESEKRGGAAFRGGQMADALKKALDN